MISKHGNHKQSSKGRAVASNNDWTLLSIFVIAISSEVAKNVTNLTGKSRRCHSVFTGNDSCYLSLGMGPTTEKLGARRKTFWHSSQMAMHGNGQPENPPFCLLENHL